MRVTLSVVEPCAVMVGCAPGAWEHAYPMSAVDRPRDDAARDAPVEWWCWVGHVAVYPARWRIIAPSLDVDVSVTPFESTGAR